MSQSSEYARGHVGGQTLYRCKILLGQTEFEPTARPCGSWRDLGELRRGIQRVGPTKWETQHVTKKGERKERKTQKQTLELFNHDNRVLQWWHRLVFQTQKLASPRFSRQKVNRIFPLAFLIIAENMLCDQQKLFIIIIFKSEHFKILKPKQSPEVQSLTKAINKLHHSGMISMSPSLSYQKLFQCLLKQKQKKSLKVWVRIVCTIINPRFFNLPIQCDV